MSPSRSNSRTRRPRFSVIRWPLPSTTPIMPKARAASSRLGFPSNVASSSDVTRNAEVWCGSSALAKAELLVLDDFGLTPLSDQSKRDLLEILDDRYDRSSTIVTSQLPVDQWHAYLADPTLADAILDRLVHNGYRLALKGESMRKQKQIAPPKPAARPRNR